MRIIALTFAAAIAFGGSSFAEDATTSFVSFPNTVRCQECGAQYHIRAKVTKDNAIQLKAELANKSANPKTR